MKKLECIRWKLQKNETDFLIIINSAMSTLIFQTIDIQAICYSIPNYI